MANGGFSQKFEQWLYGRNGSDDVARLCANVALVLVVVDLFTGTRWLSGIALCLIVYALYRAFSKDVAARARENEAFMSKLGPARPWVASPVATIKDHRDYKYMKCPDCGQRCRVPRGKGKVRVTCRACHKKFEAKA